MENAGKSSKKNLGWNFTSRTGQFEVQGATIHIYMGCTLHLS